MERELSADHRLRVKGATYAPWMAATFALAGCSIFLPAETLRPRAASDLECAGPELRFTALAGDCGAMAGDHYSCTMGVQGCGQEATYVHVDGGDWVRSHAGGRR